MAMDLSQLRYRCHWPDDLDTDAAEWVVSDDQFAAAIVAAGFVHGYSQVFWAARDGDSARRGLIPIFQRSRLHITASGREPEVQEFVGFAEQHGFVVKDLHIEMVARQLPEIDRPQLVRPAHGGDVAAISALAANAFSGYGVCTPALLEAGLDDPTRTVLVIDDAANPGAIVGFGTGSLFGDSLAHFFFHALAVRPDAKGRGFGRLLAEGLLDWARRNGASRSMLWLSNVNNTVARRLYESLGFSATCDCEVELLKD